MMTFQTLAANSWGTSELKPALHVVLADLGHLCPGDCQAAAEELRADVWSTRRSPAHDVRRHLALVVLDTTSYPGSLLRWRQLLHRIKDCTSAHGIHVAVRDPGDAGHALTASATLISGPISILCSKLSRTQLEKPVDNGRIERTS
ncbi:MAG: hypothetical protein ABI137_12070 [Antricoccus sp.]